jgi:multidrug efflux system membrane fusion protein
MRTTSLRPGAIATIVAIGVAVLLFALVLQRLDGRPRTHVAYLYADTTAMAPDVGGRLVSIRVRENQLVRAGELLAEVDPEPFDLRVRQARAQVAALEAQLGVSRRQVSSQSAGADAARTNIDRARTQLKLTNDTLSRLRPLVGPGYVTQQKLDEAVANQKSATAALEAASNQSDQARFGVGDTRALEAQLDGAVASLALAERDLRLTKVLAPFDGIVSGLDIAPGTYASPGHPLFTLIDARHWYAVADFRETDLHAIRQGDRATVWVLGGGAHSLPGHVVSLGHGVRGEVAGGPGLPSVERSLKWVVIAQRYPVRIELDAPPADLMRIGATVTVVVRGSDAR